MLQYVSKQDHIEPSLLKGSFPIQLRYICNDNFFAVAACKARSLAANLYACYDTAALDQDTIQISCGTTNIEHSLVPTNQINHDGVG